MQAYSNQSSFDETTHLVRASGPERATNDLKTSAPARIRYEANILQKKYHERIDA